MRELTREDFQGHAAECARRCPSFVEAMADLRRKLGRPKAEAPKIHIGFRFAYDIIASNVANGPGCAAPT